MLSVGAMEKQLNMITTTPVLRNVPLSAWTTFGVGGPADWLVKPENEGELEALLAFCEREKVDSQVIGRGSNLLVSDKGFRGLVIVLGDGFKTIYHALPDDNGCCLVTTGAALSLSRLTEYAAEQGLGGVEFAAGIPGSVGGAVAVNAGAWGEEFADLVVRITVVGARGKYVIERDALSFDYRTLENMSGELRGYIITEAVFRLCPCLTEKIRLKMKALRQKRKERQPIGKSSGGSFFKNPEKDSAGRLIEQSGLKGLRIGGAEVSEKHANFIINRGNATAADVIALMREVQDRVNDIYGIVLEPEVRFI